MSEGEEAESPDTEEDLEEVLEEEGQEEEQEKEPENSKYDSRNTRYKASSKDTEETPEDEDLEDVVEDAEGQKEKLVEALTKRGMSAKQARAVVAKLKKSNSREEKSHELVSISEYLERHKNYDKNANLKDAAKGIWYLALALADISSEEDPYESIDKGASKIYIPGFLAIPKNIGPLREALGEEVAYVDTTDVNEIARIVKYAKKKHGRVEVIAFSDGGKFVEGLIGEEGDIANKYYLLATNPIKYESNKIVYAIGNKDELALAEKQYTWFDKTHKGPEPHVVDGGHTSFIYDKETNRQLADIIQTNTSFRKAI